MMQGAIHTGAAGELGIGSIDHGIDLLVNQVALDQLDRTVTNVQG